MEQTIFKGDVHEDTISYSCTFWFNNSAPKSAPLVQRAYSIVEKARETGQQILAIVLIFLMILIGISMAFQSGDTQFLDEVVRRMGVTMG